MEINENQSLYAAILKRCSCLFKEGEKEELKQFTEQYITPLTINNYIIQYKNNEEIIIIIQTHNAIGQIISKRDQYNQMHLKHEFRIFPIKEILKTSISTFKRFGATWNYITIDLPYENHISFEYLPDSIEVSTFIDNLLKELN